MSVPVKRVILVAVAFLGVLCVTTTAVAAGPPPAAGDGVQRATTQTVTDVEVNLTAGTYAGSAPPDDRKVYAVNLTKGQSVNVTLSYDADASINAEMNNFEFGTLEYGTLEGPQSASDETAETRLTYEATYTGIHYLVLESDEASERIPFTLEYQVETDRFEPNGASETAPVLSPGTYEGLTLLNSEEDRYRLDLAAGESINVTATTDADAPVEPNLEVQNFEGGTFEYGTIIEPQSVSDDTDVFRLTYEARTDGTYYVVASGDQDGNAHARYDLTYQNRTDQFEPNGATKTAPTLEPGTYRNLTLLNTEEDKYRLDLAAGESINVTATTDADADVEPNLEVQTFEAGTLEYGTIIEPQSVSDDTDVFRLTYEARTDGTYYVVASGDPDGNAHARYDLTYQNQTDSFEPNGATETAPTLEPGTHENLTLLNSEEDKYRLDLVAGESINVTATTDADADVEPNLQVQNFEGGTLEYGTVLEADPIGDDTDVFRLTYEARTDGTYYVVASGDPDGNAHARYDLTYQNRTDAFEPNGAVETAPTLDPGTYDDLTLLNSESDYYAVELSEGDSINVTATSDADAAVEPRLELRNGDDGTLEFGSFEDASGPTEDTDKSRLSYEARVDGTYYIVVSGDPDGNDHARYDLTYDGPSPEQSLPALPTASGPPSDTDGDGRYEDVDGSGSANLFDAIALYNNRDSDVVRSNPAKFDFDGSGSVDLFDAIALYNEVSA